MSMFCYQCQETAKNSGCTIKGVCGKDEKVANLQDLLIETLRGISVLVEKVDKSKVKFSMISEFIMKALFATITNANFDEERIKDLIEKGLEIRECLKSKIGDVNFQSLASCVTFEVEKSDYLNFSKDTSILRTENEDVRSLRELLIIGLKGIAAYADHAFVLGHQSDEVNSFLVEALASTTKELSVDDMIGLVMKAGEISVQTMALLDKANTDNYGNPEISEVSIGVGSNPGILISGHDLKDMKMLLEQTKDSGIDIYTHSEMLPANYYPEFKKYAHLKGNYGSSWWKQNHDFASFNGPILMTTNCITPVQDSYKNRIFTTGMAGYPGVTHIKERENGTKDFSLLIELAKTCQPPKEIETGSITGGFAHAQVMALADKVVDAVKSGAIKRFVVMAGCDGRNKDRGYFTEVAQNLPKDTVILTAGCAKYRYNKLDLGDIGGIPRVLDAGQCNDSYSLAVIALKLKEVFGLDDINELPISFDIGWYEQKAVAVLLALLFLGVKGIRLGPTIPAFLSPNVAKVLIEKFNIKPIADVESDIANMLEGN